MAWTDTDIARFTERRDRLMRWGWPEAEAEAVAERLVKRDRDGFDGRVACVECKHYRPGRPGQCGNFHMAELNVPSIGRGGVASLLQRCGGAEPLGGKP